jgi:hypothetical protein
VGSTVEAAGSMVEAVGSTVEAAFTAADTGKRSFESS